jgi:hypothetical protein
MDLALEREESSAYAVKDMLDDVTTMISLSGLNMAATITILACFKN